jgi:hypothetical protein
MNNRITLSQRQDLAIAQAKLDAMMLLYAWGELAGRAGPGSIWVEVEL